MSSQFSLLKFISFLFVSATISLSWIFPVDNQNESYYSLVNAGNRQLFEGELEGALENYLDAFEEDHHHYFLDIRKAIVISHKLGLTETKLKLLLKIKQEELIDKASFMGQFEDTTIFSEREIDIIDNFKIAKNPHLQEYYDLIRSYQKVRSMGRDKTLMTDEDWIRDAKCDTYASYRDSMDEKNALLFVEYSEKYGYPFEGNIGISSFPRSEGKQPYITNAFTPFLIKSFLRTRYKDKILEIIDSGLKDGVLHPARYAWLAEVARQNEQHKDYPSMYPYMFTSVNLVRGVYYRPFVIFSDSLMNIVNSNRMQIGLDSFRYAQQQTLCTKICRDNRVDSSAVLDIHNYTIFNSLRLGIVKHFYEKENEELPGGMPQDLDWYRIKTAKIMNTCKCENLKY